MYVIMYCAVYICVCTRAHGEGAHKCMHRYIESEPTSARDPSGWDV